MKKNKLKINISLVLASVLCMTTVNVYGAEIDSKRIIENIQTLENYIDEHYLFEKNDDDLENGIYRGFVDSLGDEYSFYISPEEYEEYYGTFDGTYIGIGAQLIEDENGKKIVESVLANSPAVKAGVKAGDIIYTIDGVLAEGLSFDEVFYDYIIGEEGTVVTVEIIEKDTGNIKKLQIKRENMEYITVNGKMLDNEIAYIEILEFTTETHSEFKKTINSLEKQGMKKIIIDLRDNPGGSLDSVVKTLAYILPDKEFVYTVDKKNRGTRFYSKNGQIIAEQKPYVAKDETRVIIGEDNHQINIPIAVLVNSNSASASEILAGTLKDYKRAIVIGEKTYGKGIVQRMFSFDDGSALQLTVSHYYTPSGATIHNKGIQPDIVISDDSKLRKNGIDIQLNAAIRELND